MGFYSIYKIIKDMIRTLFGNKILKFIIITIILLILSLLLNNESKAYSTSDSLTFTFHNSTYTLPSWIEGHRYACFISSNDVYPDRADLLFILFDDNNNEYLQEYVYNNQLTFIKSSGSVGFHSIKITSITNLQSAINEYINYNTLINRSLATSESISRKFFTLSDNDAFLKSTVNIVNRDTNEPVYSTYINPSLGNTQSQLENLSFDNFIINANSFTQDMINDPDSPLVMLFYNRSLSNSSNTDGLYPIKEKYFYKESIYFDTENSTDDNYIFNYPIFKTGVFFNIGSTYEIKLAKRVYIQEYNTWGYDFFDNSYTFTVSTNVTQDYINQLNQQTATTTDEENQQQQLDAINNQTQSIDNINNSITNSTVDNSSIDLPTDNTNNPTQSGIDNIFQTIYNGFTSGTPQDIVFPLPFSSNNITIKPNYITQMLNSSERRQNCLLSYSSFLLVCDK